MTCRLFEVTICIFIEKHWSIKAGVLFGFETTTPKVNCCYWVLPKTRTTTKVLFLFCIVHFLICMSVAFCFSDIIIIVFRTAYNRWACRLFQHSQKVCVLLRWAGLRNRMNLEKREQLASCTSTLDFRYSFLANLAYKIMVVLPAVKADTSHMFVCSFENSGLFWWWWCLLLSCLRSLSFRMVFCWEQFWTQWQVTCLIPEHATLGPDLSNSSESGCRDRKL